MQPRSTKRQKEQQRAQRAQEKSAKRKERQTQKSEKPTRLPGEPDPDIAGIIPGPQPLPEGFAD